MNLLDTMKGSMMEGFYPAGWDLSRIDACCSNAPEHITSRQDFWNRDFMPVVCENVHDFNMMMGHEMALEIKKSRDEGRKLAMILPVSPMGMYRCVVYFLKEWNTDCRHVYCFNMDEWSDGEGILLKHPFLCFSVRNAGSFL